MGNFLELVSDTGCPCLHPLGHMFHSFWVVGLGLPKESLPLGYELCLGSFLDMFLMMINDGQKNLKGPEDIKAISLLHVLYNWHK